MSTSIRSLSRGLLILETLFKDDFQGKTLDCVAESTEIPKSSAWRILQALEVEGWVVGAPVGGKQARWQISTKLASIAHAYEQHALARVQGIQREFREVTGKDLKS